MFQSLGLKTLEYVSENSLTCENKILALVRKYKLTCDNMVVPEDLLFY